MSYLSAKSSVQHHEHFKLFDVVDEDLTKSIWQHVSGSLCISVANFWHFKLAPETSPDTVVNTVRFSPVWLVIGSHDV